jgi:hypothetical protein
MRTRLLLLAVVAILLALTRPACAQIHLPDASDRFAWHPPDRHVANVLSNVTLGGQVVWATVDSLRGEHKKRDLFRQGCSFGLAQGFTLGGKAAFRKLRPDGSDFKSMWSGHTASTASQGWELTAGTAYFRMAGADHDLWDTTIGAIVGFGARALCSSLIH